MALVVWKGTRSSGRGSVAQPRSVGRHLTVVAILVLALWSPAQAFFLDSGRNFDFRARFYSEAVVAAEDSQPQTRPALSTFQLFSHRNFFNPELEGKLTSYQPFGLDDLSFRLALWGFYDGVYDYGTSQYNRARQSIQGRLSQGHTNTAPVTHTDTLINPRKMYTYQPDPVLGEYNKEVSDLPFRINESYFNITKGPLFMRLGRQTISWGESDSIALLDLNNPFNLTLSQPGLFQDVDEARIPLWTARGTYNLFDSWGPFSSGFVDTYLVPGSIDTTVSQTPIPLASPYSPPQGDPQALIAGLIPPDVNAGLVKPILGDIQLGIYDHLPPRSMSKSRFGVRFGAIVDRDYTTSVWYYRTFANAPVPRFLPLDLSRAPITTPGAKGPTQIITELEHGLVDVIGGATSFFSAALNGIVRTEVEFFKDEPAFIPNKNIPFEALLRTPQLRSILNTLGQHIPAGTTQGTVPHADMLRFELGFDRFFFARALNPTNSFVWVTAYVGQANLSEIAGHGNYRFYGQQKLCPPGSSATCKGTRVGANTQGLTLQTIGKLHTVATDFVDLYPYESFMQTHLETDYMHGRLKPAVTAIIGMNGTFAVPVGLTYRFTDNLLFDFKYIYMGGAFMFPTGLSRDRSQLSARVTALLN
jgi:hypothetical protein